MLFVGCGHERRRHVHKHSPGSLSRLLRIRTKHTRTPSPRPLYIFSCTQHRRWPRHTPRTRTTSKTKCTRRKSRCFVSQRPREGMHKLRNQILSNISIAHRFPQKRKLQHQAPCSLPRGTSCTARPRPDRCRPQAEHQPQDRSAATWTRDQETQETCSGARA